MLRNRFVAALLGSALAVSAAIADGPVKSGPQVGQEVPGPFHPVNVTGKAAGKRHCLYCENGGNPVAVVFAREATPQVARLLKQLDEATAKHRDESLGSYAVFCSDNEALKGQLEGLAREQKLRHIV